jgi:hypothetical protein
MEICYIVRMGLKEIRCEDVGWTKLALGRLQWRALVNTVVNLFIKGGKFLYQMSDC